MKSDKIKSIILKTILTIILLVGWAYLGFMWTLILAFSVYANLFLYAALFSLIFATIYLIWSRHRKRAVIRFSMLIGAFLLIGGGIAGYKFYDKSLVINVTPNIKTFEYLPFEEDSKIVKLDNASLSFKDKSKNDLPIIDGAAAVFPVYSAFVNSLYPETTELYDGVFEYNNTTGGYKLLGEKKTDIFFGAYPSEEQIQTARDKGTEFEFTEIGKEAFVFFVHKNNPIENLTTEQIKGIYSGEITNWKEVGGKDEKIIAYQRNEGSGSQSMLKRFMDNTPIMEAPTEQVNDLMSGIIEKVSDYKSTTSSIGFSFRYYVEGIIKNPNIKLIAIDGVKPTIENIQNNNYPIVTSLYAVTYQGNEKEEVQELIDWILSNEGQFIIKETGYTPIKEKR